MPRARVNSVYDDAGLRRCCICQQHLDTSAFYRNASRRGDGLSARCKQCEAQKQREYRERNPEKVAAGTKRWRVENRERVKENARRWAAANPDKIKAHVRAANLKTKYGLTREAHAEMLARQGGVCAICQGGPNGGRAHLVVDHDHATGKVRGLLCAHCNVMLGYAAERPEVLDAARAYLASHSG